MLGNYWILVVILIALLVILVALGIALKRQERARKIAKLKEQEASIPSAKELIELLKSKENTLANLEDYANLAKAHYIRYENELPNFDLEFIAILSAHKGVSAPLILETQKHFIRLKPERKNMLEKALNDGLKKR